MDQDNKVRVVSEDGEVIYEASKKVKEKVAQNNYEKYRRKNGKVLSLASFIFIMFEPDELFDYPVFRADFARYTMVATYCSYKENILRVGAKNLIQTEIMEITNTSNATQYRWWKDVMAGELIVKREDGSYRIPSRIFSKGKLFEKKGARIFINEFRTMYRGISSGEHTALGNVLSLIPLMDSATNKLVYSGIYDNTTPYTEKDLIKILGYVKRKKQNPVEDMLDLKWKDGDETKYLLKQGEDGAYMVNPEIIFSGSVEEYWDSMSDFIQL